jgi:hypothetical protein
VHQPRNIYLLRTPQIAPLATHATEDAICHLSTNVISLKYLLGCLKPSYGRKRPALRYFVGIADIQANIAFSARLYLLDGFPWFHRFDYTIKTRGCK